MDVVGFVTGQSIENECGSPPGLIANGVLLLVGLRVTLTVLSRLGDIGRPAPTLIIALECWSFYLYVVYHTRCQPLKGFLLFVLKSVLIGFLERLIDG